MSHDSSTRLVSATGDVAAPSSEQLLWQAVVLAAIGGATKPVRKGSVDLQRHTARIWILGAGADFHRVCALAGLDPDFIRDAYLSGKLHAARDTEKSAFKVPYSTRKGS